MVFWVSLSCCSDRWLVSMSKAAYSFNTVNTESFNTELFNALLFLECIFVDSSWHPSTTFFCLSLPSLYLRDPLLNNNVSMQEKKTNGMKKGCQFHCVHVTKMILVGLYCDRSLLHSSPWLWSSIVFCHPNTCGRSKAVILNSSKAWIETK